MPKDSRLENPKKGDLIGNFIFVRTELVGKNKVWIMKCSCGNDKTFWKKSAINRQKTCGCGIDEAGLSGKQARSIKASRTAQEISTQMITFKENMAKFKKKYLDGMAPVSIMSSKNKVN